MKQSDISFILSIIAGLVCIGAYIYKYVQQNEADNLILIAGIFVISFGVGMRFMKRK